MKLDNDASSMSIFSLTEDNTHDIVFNHMQYQFRP